MASSVFVREHDREDACCFFWVTWIFGTVLHRLVVIVMFENELLVIDLEAAEIVLVVRIVVRSEIVERSRGRSGPAILLVQPRASSSRCCADAGLGATSI